ncbi:3'-5' exonuclease [Bacillus thuringiensis]|uniref:3'-5' exonuclease n=1 Tax=Bacillus thuringiensis TaxID=1428 RepID=UPI000BFDA6DE|nr:3'-5' exonuclease [Bacillus thuringiensis]PGY46867.1 DNA polymerase III subunit epsilon [Bacillus thuringiensis]
MNYTVIDFETTGLDYKKEQVIEISAIKLNEEFKEVSSFNTFVKLKEGKELPEFISNLTGINEVDLIGGMDEAFAFSLLRKFIGDSVIVAQYAPFDLTYLANYNIHPMRFICTKSLTSQAEPSESSSLGPTCERLGIKLENAHRAIDDARATAKVLEYRMKQDNLQIYNTLVITAGRPLNFIPKYTNLILTKDGDTLVDFRREDTE